jgi:tetratricopeptide (TPR) repeat protein
MKYLIAALFFTTLQIGAQTYFDKGEICFKKQQYDQAKPLFEKHLQQYPNDLKTVEYLGDIQSHLGHWETAIEHYKKLNHQKPNVAEYHYKYGGAMAMQAKESNVFKALSMVGDIKSEFNKAIALNPKHIGARWALIEIYIQLPSLAGGSESKAIRYANELLKISTVDGYLAHGHIEEYYKRYPEAEKQYKKAIEIGNSATTYQKLADLYKNKMDQPEKARVLMAIYNEKNKT